MFKLNSKLTMACSAAVLALAMAACSSSSDDNPPVAMGDPPPPVGDGGPDPVLTELEMAQAAAAAAATAAMTASDEAATAAAAAMAAVANLATMQTNATAGALAYEAHTAAGKAMAAYEHAKAASEDAAAAEEVTAAVEARVLAETAMANAVKYAATASEKGTAAETAATAELMIVGTVKTVGGTDLDAEAGASTVTTNGDSVITGLIKDLNPDHTVAMTVGGLGTDKSGPDAEPVAYVAPTASVGERTFDIGKVVDSADDMARLMIVTQYAGSKTVNVYASTGLAEDTGPLTGRLLSDGRIQTGGVPTPEVATDDRFVTLKPAGMYYLGSTTATFPDNEAAVVAAKAKPVQVFSYTDTGPDFEAGTDDDVSGHAVFVQDTTTSAGVTTVFYAAAEITFGINRDGDPDTGDATGDEEVAVTAKIPDAAEYEHIHFGVWAALGAPEEDGSQELSDLGIGFVQSIGDGLSGADMPNNGEATYSGNWAAAVQAEDEDGDGDISLVNNAATLTADFSEATIEAELTGLATLEGAIDTNTFSGTKATVGAGNLYNLDSSGKFTGSFSGGFYGKQAAEAGGIFDFTSKDAEAGAFSGAFGGNKVKKD